MRCQIWWNLTEADWDEAFNAHPRIGDVNALKQVPRACLLVHCSGAGAYWTNAYVRQ